jgi:glutamate formiminotransferase/formiminotetrahydrofolate cyclodeaminase
MKLIECVPNFSEGRDLKVIEEISNAIKNAGGKLLDVDPGNATNRTVITFIATPKIVVNAAFAGIKKASELIDMSTHHGAHARMGATDVCPLIPISGVSIEECIELSKELAKKVADELGIATYLYEHAAQVEERRNLAVIRSGEYEGFFEKIKQEKWKPDFGQAIHNKKSGSTVIGVREFLIAYNINLNTKSTLIARKIANRIREKGYPKKDENGNFIKINGEIELEPGLFKNVKAVGWYIEEYKRAQISINLTNFNITPIYEVFDAVCELETEFGVRVTGSELVGLIPKKAIYDAGIHFIKKSNQPYGVSEKEIIETAIQSLGLSELSLFEPNEKIIEYKVAKKRELINMSITDFVDELASNSPAPGGGSIAALTGALSSSLVSMVGNLTVGKPKYKEVSEEMKELSFKAQQLKEFFINIIDDDTDAFNDIMGALKLPKGNNEENEIRTSAIEEATKNATLIPFSVMEKIVEIYPLIETALTKGNQLALSDAGVASLNAKSAFYGAYYNVLINIRDIENESFKKFIKEKSLKLKEIVDSYDNKLSEFVFSKLSKK